MEAIIKTTKAIASRESSGERNRNREQSREINQESDYDKMRNEQDMQEVSGINNYEVIKAIMARILLNQNILNRKARIDIEHDLDSYYHHFPEQDNQISEEQIQSAMDTKLKGFERERVEKKLNYANNTQSPAHQPRHHESKHTPPASLLCVQVSSCQTSPLLRW